MNRRRFVGTVAAATLLRPASADIAVELIHPRNPYDRLLRDIEPGHDAYPAEKAAFELATHLRRLTELRTLPLAPGLRGISPFPERYNTVDEGVSRAEFTGAPADIVSGLTLWLDSLGPIRAARFYVLPNDTVRFEIASSNRHRVGLWKLKWDGSRITQFDAIEETVATTDAPLFRDVTGHAFATVDSFHNQLRQGVPWWRGRLDAATGIDVHGHNGIAVGDIDNDGFDEIYVCQPGGLPNRLYKNRGQGQFEDITEQSGVGVLDPTSCALFLDLRNSGLQDLVVLRPDGPLLFINLGENRFAHRPGAFRFAVTPQGSFTGMAAADYDRDGRVDLYLCTYSFFRDGNQYRYPSPYFDAQNGPANFLFHNQLAGDGSGTFVDVTRSTGIDQNNNRFSFAPAWCDYNGDGWPDLLVANDFGRKNLYKNEGGRFRDVAAEAGVEDIGDGMSASWFDYDGDGRPDLYVSNMWSDAGQRLAPDAWKRHAKGNSLFRNKGDGTFEETGAAEGVEMGRWAWSSDGVDFDNDGTPEIFVATGMLTNSSETDLESFFWRKVANVQQGPAYEDGWNALSQAVHEKYSEAGRQPNVFYVRRGGKYYDFSGVSGLDFADDSRAFAVTDFDNDGNLDLLLKSRLGPQIRVLQNNCGHRKKSIAFRLCGVKSNRDAIGARIEVDGRVKFVAAGSGYISQHSKVVHFGLSDNESARAIRILWPSGAQQEFQNLASGFLYEIEEASPHPRGVPFEPRIELPSVPVAGENTAGLANTWLAKPIPLPEPAPGPGFLRLTNLSPERAALYSVFCRYLFDLRADLKLPVWLLVDEQSRVHKICFSPPTPDQTAPVPFGRYYTEPARNYTALGAAFFAAGFPEHALKYLELAPQDRDPVLLAIGKIHLQARRWEKARTYLAKLPPDSADKWNSLGGVEVGVGNLPAALRDFDKALALQPAMVSALINAGQAQMALGDRDSAEKLFRRALEARPDSEPAINSLASLYASGGKTGNAIAALRYGIERLPDEESFYLNLAALYVRIDNREAARPVIDQLLLRRPDSLRAKQASRELER